MTPHTDTEEHHITDQERHCTEELRPIDTGHNRQTDLHTDLSMESHKA